MFRSQLILKLLCTTFNISVHVSEVVTHPAVTADSKSFPGSLPVFRSWTCLRRFRWLLKSLREASEMQRCILGARVTLICLKQTKKKTKRQRAPVILWWRWRRSRLEGLLCVVVLIGAPPRRGLQFFLFLCCFCRNNPPVLFRGVRGLVRAAAGRVA